MMLGFGATDDNGFAEFFFKTPRQTGRKAGGGGPGGLGFAVAANLQLHFATGCAFQVFQLNGIKRRQNRLQQANLPGNILRRL